MDEPKWEPAAAARRAAVLWSAGPLHIWAVSRGRWHGHVGCAKVAAVGFLATVSSELPPAPLGGWLLGVRGGGAARDLISQALERVHPSRPYPHEPSLAIGALSWAVNRSGVSFEFIGQGELSIMAKSKAINTSAPAALPSSAQRGSLMVAFHDVVALECSYERAGGDVRINVVKSHLTGSLEQLVTSLVGKAFPVLFGDRPDAQLAGGSEGGEELEKIDPADILGALAPQPTAQPKLAHSGGGPELPAASERLGEVLPPEDEEAEAAAASIDALVGAQEEEEEAVDAEAALGETQSADGGQATQVEESLEEEEIEMITLGDPLADAGVVEVEDTSSDDVEVEVDGDATDAGDSGEELETEEIDTAPLETGSGTVVKGQPDVVHEPISSVFGNDDAEIEVEPAELDDADAPLSPAQAEEEIEPEDELPFDTQSTEGEVPMEVLDNPPPPVGTKRSQTQTNKAVAKAKTVAAKPAGAPAAAKPAAAPATSKPAAAASKPAEPAVKPAAAAKGKVAAADAKPQAKPAQGGLAVPTATELKARVDSLSDPAKKAKAIEVRNTISQLPTLAKLDPYGQKLLAKRWPETLAKLKDRPIEEIQRFLVGYYLDLTCPPAK